MRSLTWKGSPEPHPVKVEDGDLNRVVKTLAGVIRREKRSGRAFLVTSRRIYRLYRKTLFEPLAARIEAPAPILLPDGEDKKTQTHLGLIFDKLLANRADRRDLIVAVGGGVVTDMAGFAAAVFKRGLAWMAVPTTLTGQVDAALGGKTGVDYGAGKNMIGAFWQPLVVFVAPVFLQTLTARDLRCGLSEVVKTGIALNPKLLERVERDANKILSRDHRALCEIVFRCAAEKLQVVAQDPLDQGVRAVLNLGHTAGHAIEAAGKFRRWNHGQAVALGLLIIAAFARDRGMMTGKDQARVIRVIRELGLAPLHRPKPEDAAPYLVLDKKSIGRRISAVVPGPIGTTTMVLVEPQELLDRRYWSWT